MRIEKGHAAGNELNGQTTATNLGMRRLVSAQKDGIGAVLSQRPALSSEDGLHLMGFIPEDPAQRLRAGAHFLHEDASLTLANDEGWMSSVAYSPTLGSSIGLGFIKNGRNRSGETIMARDPVRNEHIKVHIVSPHFVDPDGERLRG
jgi:sarcosine oxidase subunit alpha